MAEIVPVVSEALEAQVRSLLPSQRGFGEDLQASNVIMPVIDLTAAAEGTTTPEYLQRAQAFGSQTSFAAATGSTDIITTVGFWQITGVVNISAASATNSQCTIVLNDGSTDKTIYYFAKGTTPAYNEFLSVPIEFIIFLRAGDKLAVTNTAGANFFGSYRQVADVNGVLVNPSGFTPQ